MDKKQPKVIVYSTSWCGFCHSLMHWLDKQGVAYEEVDVEADPAANEEMLRRTKGQFVVPVTAIGEDTVVGFDRPGIKAALKKYTN